MFVYAFAIVETRGFSYREKALKETNMDNSIQTLFETAEDVARWLEDQGFSPETTGAFIGSYLLCWCNGFCFVFF